MCLLDANTTQPSMGFDLEYQIPATEFGCVLLSAANIRYEAQENCLYLCMAFLFSYRRAGFIHIDEKPTCGGFLVRDVGRRDDYVSAHLCNVGDIRESVALL
ncbi:MAG: hypothetical protein SPF78_07940 [Lachnospiraceae bacterium]|nr:hypothetical protein [Lachnospiraceae bacterium]